MTTAKLIKHSKSSVNGKEILTFELVYPRIVHAELMTHRQFSRNAASSRAIPIDKLIKLVEEDCAMPAEWGLNQPGMQAYGRHKYSSTCELVWKQGAKRAIQTSRELQALGLHKQICNRPLECYQYIKTIVTSTEWANWFWLRNHEHADPTIQQLAREMWKAEQISEPQILKPGQYHLPYIDTYICPEYKFIEYNRNDDEATDLTIEQAIKISTSCCAQVSYRVLDDSLNKAIKIYTQLVSMSPVHASPTEHQATPLPEIEHINGNYGTVWPKGVTHIDQFGNYCSGNLTGWLQHRQSVKGHVHYGDSRDN